MIALLIFAHLLSVLICCLIAGSRQADRRYWFFAALLFGPLAIPFAFFAGPDQGRTKRK